MYERIILPLLAFVALVKSHDVIVGLNTEGKKIFDEKIEASPAIWRQTQNVTVNATESDVISRVVITDLRPDKDGDAKIVDGGEGKKNVTIELKSPTALRGYDFHVQVFAVPDKNQHKSEGNNKDFNHPSLIGNGNTPEEKNNLRRQSEFKTSRTDLDSIPKFSEAPINKNQPLPVSMFTDFKVNDNNEPPNPAVAGNQNTPLTNQDRRNGREQENHDITNTSKTPMAYFPPPQFSRNTQTADTPATVSKDMKVDNTQTRHVRDTRQNDEKTNNNQLETQTNGQSKTSNTSRNIDLTNTEADKREKSNTGKFNSKTEETVQQIQSRQIPSFVPLNVERSDDVNTNAPPVINAKRDTRDIKHDDEEDHNIHTHTRTDDAKSTSAPAIFGKTVAGKGVSTTDKPKDTDQDESKHDESLKTPKAVVIDSKIQKISPPVVNKNTEDTRNYQLRNKRDTHSENKDPIVPSITSQIGDLHITTKNGTDDQNDNATGLKNSIENAQKDYTTKELPKPYPMTFLSNFSSTTEPRNSTSTTADKLVNKRGTDLTDSDEASVSGKHGDTKLKAVPRVLAAQNNTRQNEKKPLISIQ